MKAGIVGLPNVGKSTLFNCLSNVKAQSANFPFCTIEPNIGIINVPDKRLSILDDLVNLYLKELIIFNREYDIPSFGPSSEHKVRYKWYAVTINKKKTIKDLRKVIKDGKI